MEDKVALQLPPDQHGLSIYGKIVNGTRPGYRQQVFKHNIPWIYSGVVFGIYVFFDSSPFCNFLPSQVPPPIPGNDVQLLSRVEINKIVLDVSYIPTYGTLSSQGGKINLLLLGVR